MIMEEFSITILMQKVENILQDVWEISMLMHILHIVLQRDT